MRLLVLALLPFCVFIAMAAPEASVNHAESPYPEHLDEALTGGFDEETCHSCHFDYDVNDDQGSLAVEGVEETYQPGEQYELTVTVEGEELEIGGFQMTSRFEDGSQAGDFEWDDDRLTLTPSISDEVAYVQHSAEGTRPTGEGKIAWSLTWTAPESDARPVVFNVAANAGNDDDSPFGDWIYVEEITVQPVE